MTGLQQVIEDYANGNLTLALSGARKYTRAAIYNILVNENGYSELRANATANYLKTGKGFQAACDAK